MILFKGRETHSRSLVKAISWRVLGSIDTFLIGWLFTGHAETAGMIAGTEVLTKLILFYGHERVWAVVPFGVKADATETAEVRKEANAAL